MKGLDYIGYLWGRAAHYYELKSFIAIILGIVSYLFDPLHNAALLALFLLIILDFFFGVAAAKRTGLQITSAKFARTPIKLVVYFTLIAASRISEYALPEFMGFLDETLLGFLVCTELLSLLEKAGYMGFAIPRKLLNQLEKYTQDEGI